MKFLPIDTSALRFLAAADPELSLDYESKKPKSTRDGEPIHTLDLLVSGEGRRGEVITVKVAGQKPAVSEGARVKVTALVGMQWTQEGRNGVSFMATRIEPAPASSKAA